MRDILWMVGIGFGMASLVALFVYLGEEYVGAPVTLMSVGIAPLAFLLTFLPSAVIIAQRKNQP